MKIIDRLLLKFGYIKLNDGRMKIINESKYDIQLLRMEYEVPHDIVANAIIMPEGFLAMVHETQLRKFLEQIVPFIERRTQRILPGRSNIIDAHRHELRLFVAKPKSWQL